MLLPFHGHRILRALRNGGTLVDIEGETIGMLTRMEMIDAVRAKALPPLRLEFKHADDGAARSLTHVFDDTGLGIERVDAYTALLREPDLHGACWSVMVDQILNGRFPGIDRLFRNQVPQNAGRWYAAPSDRVH